MPLKLIMMKRSWWTLKRGMCRVLWEPPGARRGCGYSVATERWRHVATRALLLYASFLKREEKKVFVQDFE